MCLFTYTGVQHDFHITWVRRLESCALPQINPAATKHQLKHEIRKKYKTIKSAKNECRPCNSWNINCLSFQSTLVFCRRPGPVPSHSSTNRSTLLTLSLCRSSRDHILSPHSFMLPFDCREFLCVYLRILVSNTISISHKLEDLSHVPYLRLTPQLIRCLDSAPFRVNTCAPEGQ
jgi:hypothetical protein